MNNIRLFIKVTREMISEGPSLLVAWSDRLAADLNEWTGKRQ